MLSLLLIHNHPTQSPPRASHRPFKQLLPRYVDYCLIGPSSQQISFPFLLDTLLRLQASPLLVRKTLTISPPGASHPLFKELLRGDLRLTEASVVSVVCSYYGVCSYLTRIVIPSFRLEALERVFSSPMIA